MRSRDTILIVSGSYVYLKRLGGFCIRTRHEVQLKLLDEMDTICSDNGLHYFLIGANSLSAFKDQTIDNGSRMVAVAMPSEDIEIFAKIVKKNITMTDMLTLT